MIRFECPYCGSSLEMPDNRGGRPMTCPFCKGQVDVPKPFLGTKRDSYAIKDDKKEADESDAADKVELPEELPPDDLLNEEPRKKREKPKLEWQLFIGGFAFPWTPGAIWRWVLLAFWATIAGFVAAAAVNLTSFGCGDLMQSILAMLATGCTGVFVSACLAIAAIHGLTILLETTAANDRIEHWPEVGLFVDWASDLFFVINSTAVSVMLGMGLNWLVRDLYLPTAWVVGAAVFVLFPIFLLGVLETDSALLPLSLLVLQSLFLHTIAWLAFYLQSGGMLAGAVSLILFLLSSSPQWLAVPASALVFAAAVMIYFRLLGRLAYYCSIEPELKTVG